MSHSSAPERATGAVITDWRPEDPAFWQQRGQRIASRNLWISVPLSVAGVLRMDVVQRCCGELTESRF